VASSWIFLSTLNYDARSTTHQIYIRQCSGVLVQPLLLWKTSEYHILWVRFCSFKCPAYNAHTPFCHLCPAPLYTLFPHFHINGNIFEKIINSEYKKCVFFCTTFVWNISHFKKVRVKYNLKIYSCPILIKFEFSRYIFDKTSKIKFRENPSSLCGLADGQT